MIKNLLLILLVFIAKYSYEQTNISGGIYSDAIWTKVNSPYIITDTVVVFPGVTLTIEPGVTVKFNNGKFLEIRQSKLIAEGTINDSITFTSVSSSPIPGIYEGIYLNGVSVPTQFTFCNFFYANAGIQEYNTYDLIVRNSRFIFNKIGLVNHKIIIDSSYFENNFTAVKCPQVGSAKNSIFINNTTGLDGIDTIINCTIINNEFGVTYPKVILHCTVKYNNKGIDLSSESKLENCTIVANGTGVVLSSQNIAIKNCIIDSNNTGLELHGSNNIIYNCSIKNNKIGIISYYDNSSTTITRNIIESDSIGIILASSTCNIFCNKICCNDSFLIKYTSTSNTTIANNYWCVNDSASLAAKIFDGYDDVAYGLVTFMPMDTSCYLDSMTAISETYKNNAIRIFPNPSNGKFIIETENIIGKIIIANILGKIIYHSAITEQQTIIDLTPHPNGLYFYFLHTVDGNMQSGKFIIEY